MENTEESKLNSEKIGKIWKKTVKWYGKYGRKANTEENCEKKPKLNSEKRWKTWKKWKLNSDKIWKVWKKSKLNSEDMENMEENREMI